MADTNYYVDGDAGNDSNNGLTSGAAKLTIQAGLDLATGNGDIVNVKRRATNATYDITAGLTTPSGPSFSTLQRLRGYGSTVGDGTKALVKATAGSLTMFASSSQGWLLQDLELDGNSQTSVRGVSLDQLSSGVVNCTLRRFTNSAVNGGRQMVNCWVKDCTTQPAVVGATDFLYGCALTGNTAGGYAPSASHGCAIRCLFVGNTGGSTDAVATNYDTRIVGCTFYANGRHGINCGFYTGADGPFLLNVFVLNGGYGLNFPNNSYGGAASPQFDYNAFGQGTQANTSGMRNNMTAGGHDISLTSNIDPFTDATNWATKTTLADLFAAFAPNNTSGGGALLRAAGFP